MSIHDTLTPIKKPKFRPHEAPPGRIGVFNTKGQRIGHVGPHAGVGVVRKLLGGGSAEIGKVKGKHSWIATGPSRSNAVTRAASAKLVSQIRTDRGSAKK